MKVRHILCEKHGKVTLKRFEHMKGAARTRAALKGMQLLHTWLPHGRCACCCCYTAMQILEALAKLQAGEKFETVSMHAHHVQPRRTHARLAGGRPAAAHHLSKLLLLLLQPPACMVGSSSLFGGCGTQGR